MTKLSVVGIALGLAIGVAAGIGSYTFLYAQGASYLTNDPAACANCHVMRGHYDAWTRSSHHTVAVCNDCHTPPDFVGKWTTKMLNGFWHSFYFTTGRFPEPIQITARNRAVTEQACRKCHAPIVQALESGGRRDVSCIRCHSTVGHLE